MSLNKSTSQRFLPNLIGFGNALAKSFGRIRMKLDVRALVDGRLTSPYESATQKIGDMTWSISAHRRLTSGLFDPVEKYGLGFFLKCHGPPADPAWRRDAYALMRIVAQEPGVDDHCRAIGHTFKPSEIDWGYSQFTSFDVSLYQCIATSNFLR